MWTVDHSNVVEIDKYASFRALEPIDLQLAMLSLDIVPDQVEAVIDAFAEPDRTIARLYWTRSLRFLRGDEILNDILTALGKEESDRDAMWRYGESFA
jgi:hypothetical protein